MENQGIKSLLVKKNTELESFHKCVSSYAFWGVTFVACLVKPPIFCSIFIHTHSLVVASVLQHPGQAPEMSKWEWDGGSLHHLYGDTILEQILCITGILVCKLVMCSLDFDGYS